MSLREPNLPTPNDHIRRFLDRFTREARDTGRSAFSFTELSSRASIPRDLRERLLSNLLREEYVTREGDQVRITSAGMTLVATPLIPVPLGTPNNPSPSDRQSRVRTPGDGTRSHVLQRRHI
jgi:hypothetical protein